jgi:hypothetical protein
LLESERDQDLKDFGSNRFSFVREIAERVVEQNNQLIQKARIVKIVQLIQQLSSYFMNNKIFQSIRPFEP